MLKQLGSCADVASPDRSGCAILALTAALAARPDLFYPYLAFVLPLDAKPAESIPQLALKATISLGNVKGRIDHMALDPARKRLFVAEFGNNSLGVVDVQEHRLETRLTGPR